MCLVPLALFYTLTVKRGLTHGHIFLAIYVLVAAYFSAIMVRLVLLLAPAVCVMAGIACGWLIRISTKGIR